ncbi:MAG TPA: hypothetical protein VFV10_01915, partial [Gammaproteobacteria bacterium]|nr:hypothetical protein [Gammaproteobacteria bacterium]
RTQSAAQSAVSTARGATSQARRQARRARIGAQQMLADQPLLLGALGLAAGALLGAAMPATEQEDRSIGRLRDRALEKAKGAGAEGMRRAREKAEQLASEGREALMDEGQRANEGRTDADRSARSAEAAASSEPSSRIPSDGPSTGTERTGDLHAETDVRVTTPQAPGS